MRYKFSFINFVIVVFIAAGLVNATSISASAVSTVTVNDISLNTNSHPKGFWEGVLVTQNMNFISADYVYNNKNYRTYIYSPTGMKHDGNNLISSSSVVGYFSVLYNDDDGTESIIQHGFPNYKDPFCYLTYMGCPISNIRYHCPDGIENPGEGWFDDIMGNVDIDDVNTYPVGMFNVMSPKDSIRTAGDYVDFVFGAKMPFYISDLDSVLGTYDDYKYNNKIRQKVIEHLRDSFKYSVTCGNKSYSCNWTGYDNRNTLFEVQFGSNPSDWASDGSYNVLIKTRIYVGSMVGKLSFKFTDEFFERVNYLSPDLSDDFFPFKAEYGSYSCKLELERTTYTDTNMDGIDDNDGSVIPPKDLEGDEDISDENLWAKIKRMVLGFPDFVSDLYEDFINMINNVIAMVNSINSKSFELITGFMKFFDFLPSPLPQIIWTALGGLIFFSFVSWVRR